MDIDPKSPTGVEKLLPELLSEIFSYAISPSSPHASNPGDIYTLLREALVLSSICRSWRAIAHSTRSFWASLSLETEAPSSAPAFNLVGLPRPTPTIYRTYPRMELVEKWMERSASYPLDLILRTNIRLGAGTEGKEEGDRITHLVRRNHFRLRSLRIGCTPPERLGLEVLESLIEEGDMPKLEVLVVHVGAISSTFKPITLKVPYSKRLLELELDVTVDIVFPSTPFENLRSLTITTRQRTLPSLNTDGVLEMLDGCSSTLVSFSWSIPIFPLGPPSSQKQITLPSLKNLHISTYSSPTSFFALLTLPSLVSLNIEVYQECELPLSFHPGLLSRSICPKTGKTNLEEIFVQTETKVPHREVLEMLKVSPALLTFLFTVPLTEELALSLVAESDPSSSNSYPGERTLAPHLHHMEFSLSWEGENNRLFEAFTKMVLSRWGGPSGLYPGKGRLKSVRLGCTPDVVRSAMFSHPVLEDCLEEGLVLEVI